MSATLPDISHKFVFTKWTAGNFDNERLAGELGVPGAVMTHRDVAAQRVVSAGSGEHAGHRIGIQFGAPGGAINLGLQNPNMNTFAPREVQNVLNGPGGSYLKLEREWADKLKANWKIWVEVTDKYRKGEGRPLFRTVHWTETDPSGNKNQKTLYFGNFSSPQLRNAGR
jgi:hypothetical protein